MTKLTATEERLCQHLLDEGQDYWAERMRARFVCQHEVFEELKHVDVDTLYGPAVTDVMRNAMKKAIAEGDHEFVASLHSLCLSFEESHERSCAEKEAVQREEQKESSFPLDTMVVTCLLTFFAIGCFITLLGV